jgi:hypothetical protein
MNQYIFIRRLRGPAILLLIGTLALLHTSGVIDRPWHLFWPLLLIMLGVLLLAERAALAAEGGDPLWPFSGPANSGAPPQGMGSNVAPSQEPGTSIVPAASHDFGKDPEGGQS